MIITYDELGKEEKGSGL